jgi:hypothetical protein
MRRLTRLDRSIDRKFEAPSLLPRSAYLCRSCRIRSSDFRASTAGFSTISSRSKKNENPVWTERFRRKLWGTDNPPGQKDPYGGKGLIEQAAEARREARAAKRQAQAGVVEASKTEEAEVQEHGLEISKDLPESERFVAKAGPEYVAATSAEGLHVFGGIEEHYEPGEVFSK